MKTYKDAKRELKKRRLHQRIANLTGGMFMWVFGVVFVVGALVAVTTVIGLIVMAITDKQDQPLSENTTNVVMFGMLGTVGVVIGASLLSSLTKPPHDNEDKILELKQFIEHVEADQLEGGLSSGTMSAQEGQLSPAEQGQLTEARSDEQQTS